MSSEVDLVLGNLASAVNLLEGSPEFAALIPEVRVNLVYALPRAKTTQEVAAVEGRITAVRGMPRASGMPGLGASDHMARLILEVNQHDPEVKAGINFKCDAAVIRLVQQYCDENGLVCGKIDRTKEPAEAMEQDRASMPWKIAYLLLTYGKIPRIFYEGEGWGKEPLFVVLGRDAVEATGIALELARRYHRTMGT